MSRKYKNMFLYAAFVSLYRRHCRVLKPQRDTEHESKTGDNRSFDLGGRSIYTITNHQRPTKDTDLRTSLDGDNVERYAAQQPVQCHGFMDLFA